MLVVLSILLGIYALICVIMYFEQGSLIYPAPRTPSPKPDGFEEIRYRTDDGLDLRAGYRAAHAGKPTILFFHGNGADWPSTAPSTAHLTAQGYGVLAAEFRGYWGNPGSPNEQGLYADGRAALAYLASKGIAPKEIIIIGNSIGTGTAVQMASEQQPQALILTSPYASFSQLIGEKFPWLPTRILLKDHYESVEKLPNVTTPTLIIHGDQDGLIPVAHAHQLAATNPNAKLEILRGYGHDLNFHDVTQDMILNFLNGDNESTAK